MGWFNVDAMLATGEPKHLAEWEEFNQLEPFGNDWLRTSTANARLVNTLQMIAAGLGKVELKESDWLDDDYIVPKRRDAQPTARRKELEKSVEILESMTGFQ